MYDILIIGSGPAGLTAAIYGSRANKKVAVLSGLQPGGQLTKTTHIENFPGFADPILGPDLMQAMLMQAKNMHAEMLNGSLISLEKKGDIFIVNTDSEILEAKSLIIATGADAKWLGIEQDFVGYGVSSCATCDGAFFRNRIVAVIGGGNSAVEEALYLSNIAKKVYLIHRRHEFRAEAIMQKRLDAKENIEKLVPYHSQRFYAKENSRLLQGIELENLETKEIMKLEVDGAFIAIGHVPNTSFLKGILDLDENGYVKAGVVTKISGLFVAGDVFDHTYRQAITAAGFGCMAAIEAIRFLEG